ncbi:MAG: glucosaminidase domain-containing protein [Candidatus Anstonellales archaeon]
MGNGFKGVLVGLVCAAVVLSNNSLNGIERVRSNRGIGKDREFIGVKDYGYRYEMPEYVKLNIEKAKTIKGNVINLGDSRSTFKNEVAMNVKKEKEKRLVASRGANVIKLSVNSYEEGSKLDIRVKSNWEYNDFKAVVNEEMYPLIPVVIKMEKEVGVNALYLMAVAINETGWGKKFSGKNNYFNWTPDAKRYYNFDDMNELYEFSARQYKNKYLKYDFYDIKQDRISIELVNTRYAILEDGTPNKEWADTVIKVMVMLSKRLKERV